MRNIPLYIVGLVLLVGSDGFAETRRPTLKGLLKRYSPINLWVPQQVKPKKSWNFLVFGDTQHQPSIAHHLSQRMLREPAELVLHTGDLVGSGARLTQWAKFLAATRGLRAKIPFYPTLGNHERFYHYYLKLFRLPSDIGRYYAFKHRGIQFIAVDSNRLWGRRGRAQDAWLAQKLASHPRGWSVVYFHHPPISTSTRVFMSSVSKRLLPTLKRYGVRLVFSGHFHHYERLKHHGIQIVISGGGGGKLRQHGVVRGYPQKLVIAHHYCRVAVTGRQLKLEAIRIDGKLIDSFTMLLPSRQMPLNLPLTRRVAPPKTRPNTGLGGNMALPFR